MFLGQQQRGMAATVPPSHRTRQNLLARLDIRRSYTTLPCKPSAHPPLPVFRRQMRSPRPPEARTGSPGHGTDPPNAEIQTPSPLRHLPTPPANGIQRPSDQTTWLETNLSYRDYFYDKEETIIGIQYYKFEHKSLELERGKATLCLMIVSFAFGKAGERRAVGYPRIS